MRDYYIVETSPGKYYGLVRRGDYHFEAENCSFDDAVKYANITAAKYFANSYKGKIMRVTINIGEVW